MYMYNIADQAVMLYSVGELHLTRVNTHTLRSTLQTKSMLSVDTQHTGT